MGAPGPSSDGSTLSVAIDRSVTVAVSPRVDHFVHGATTHCAGMTVAPRDSAANAGWHGWLKGPLNLIAAISRYRPAAMRFGFNVAIDSDIPVGAGLAASTAVQISLACALNQLYDLSLSTTELAHLVYCAENSAEPNIANNNRHSSIFGQRGAATFFDTATNRFEYVPFDIGAVDTVMLLTEYRDNDSTVAQLNLRQSYHRGAAPIVSVLGSRDYRSMSSFPRASDSRANQELDHFLSEEARTTQAADALKRGDLSRLGCLMAASHLSLTRRVGVAPETEAAVEMVQAHGVLGARALGRKNTQCALMLTPSGSVRTIQDRLSALSVARGWRTPSFHQLAPSGGARGVLKSDHRRPIDAPTHATIRDVAERAGVSYQTVSRAINHPNSVAGSTLARVQDAITQLNFSPNNNARALRMRRPGS